jgi:hypothetical protein
MKAAEASTDRFWRHPDVRGDGSETFASPRRLLLRWKTKVTTSQQVPPWTLGIATPVRNLAPLGLLPVPQ